MDSPLSHTGRGERDLASRADDDSKIEAERESGPRSDYSGAKNGEDAMLKWIAAILVGLLALAFWGYSALDIYWTLSGYELYVSEMPADMIAWVQGFPLWRKILWGATVGVGLIGALLLLFRAGLAAWAMLAAFALMLAGFLLDLAILQGTEMYGREGLIGSGVLTGITLIFAVLALILVKRGSGKITVA